MEDISIIIKQMREERMKNSSQMRLGQIIKAIEDIIAKDPEKERSVEYSFGSAIPTTLDSWRGSYAELALGYTLTGYDADDSNHHGKISAEELLKELKEAIGKEYTGWKGGEYTMNENTPVWVANPGNSGNTVIVDVLDEGWGIILITGYCKY